jgi:hypothetical protein
MAVDRPRRENEAGANARLVVEVGWGVAAVSKMATTKIVEAPGGVMVVGNFVIGG